MGLIALLDSAQEKLSIGTICSLYRPYGSHEHICPPVHAPVHVMIFKYHVNICTLYFLVRSVFFSSSMSTMCDESFAVSDTMTSSSPVTVHGMVVGQVSPLKTSRSNSSMKYFNGSFTDVKKTLRIISFDPKLHNQFEEVQKSCTSVALKKCEDRKN